ncbi:Uma2 family endonuclease [Stigmatella sp. ncwal1]|uniref:Uma2 family endonuclease n=1 Tax=Stigmatella ashevillensis TaxID=2995309 RepID=A0ABT5D4P8_9BACT|nr:Uma2 family endonuclease [Stigmatella ashevillena]MDC0707808.1 Uma2 family endonuclease [Stigmatella ashevillena]
MSPKPAPEATYEQLIALPENTVGQIIAGELIASPRPASDHATASSALGGELYGPFQRGRGGPGGWWIVDEPELHLGKDVLVPDLAGWRRARLPTIPRVPYFSLVPDWVCEVLSPSTAGLDRVRKKHVYAREGVEFVWLVDPIGRTLEVFQLRDGRWLELGAWSGEESIRAPPFDAISLELGALWLPETQEPPGTP